MIGHLVDLATLALVLAGMLLRAAVIVGGAMAILWLIGMGFPYVAQALGIPQETVYELLVALYEFFRGLFAPEAAGAAAGSCVLGAALLAR